MNNKQLHKILNIFIDLLLTICFNILIKCLRNLSFDKEDNMKVESKIIDFKIALFKKVIQYLNLRKH